MLRFLDPVVNLQAFRVLWRNIRRHRELLWEMTVRDLLERQAGLAFGAFWVIGQPLLMMIVYVFVFSFIFTVRLNVHDSGLGYTAYLMAGLVPWLAFQEALSRAPTIILESRSLVKQIVFPIDILPLKLVLSTFVILAVGLAFPLCLMLVGGTARPLFWLLLPVPVLSHLALAVGLTYALAATGIFLRDTRNIVQLFLMVGLFLHPILYAPGMVPAKLEYVFYLSPLSHTIWIYRDALSGDIAHPWSWIVAPLAGLLALVLGYRLFRSLSHMFGDAL